MISFRLKKAYLFYFFYPFSFNTKFENVFRALHRPNFACLVYDRKLIIRSGKT